MGAYRLRGIFSKNLKDVLSRNSITQAELADMMGVSYSSVSAWCTGVKMPRMDKIEWIANRFGIQKSDLIEDRGDLNNVASGDFAKVQYAGPIAAHFNATPTELHEYWPVPPEWLGHRKPEDFFIALVDGNSMYPHYQDGDYILCLRCSDMEYSGRVGIMLLAGGEATLKKIEYKPGEDWIDLVPMNPEYLTTRIEDAGLPHMRFHDLRHMNASIMLQLGIPEKYAMERGGWTTNSTLQNVYQHTFSKERALVDEKVDEYFNKLLG